MSAIPARLLELSPHDRLQLEAWLAEFEEGWDDGRLAAQVQRLPAPGQPLRLAALIELVKIDLERHWQRGPGPGVADYLPRFPELGPADALPPDLLLVEEEARRQFSDASTLRPHSAAGSDGGGEGAAEASTRVAPGEPLPAVAGYEIRGKLGQGGMGLVVRGRDPHLGRDVAIKLLRPEYQALPQLVRRFLKEARVHGRLQHPGVVPLYQLGELPGRRPYFSMKLVEGRTLAVLLAERAGPARDLPRFLGIFEQVCQTLAYAHAQGVIHRDLKPSNVMVGAFGEVQVMDWGLAKVLRAGPEAPAGPAPQGEVAADREGAEDDAGALTRWGEVLGTVAYMPPEQARGEVGRMDERTDVFGLGAMLCKVLTGEPPFAGRTCDEALARARVCDHAEAMARLDGCEADADLVRLAKECLAAEPSERPRDAGVVARQVTAYLEGVRERLRAAELERAAAQARAAEARATMTAERRARRRTVALAAALLLMLAGLGGGAWWAQRQRQATDATVERGLTEANVLQSQAWLAPVIDVGRFEEARDTARRAGRLAEEGRASAAVRQRAADLVGHLEEDAAAARRDHRLLEALLAVRGPREGPRFRKDDKGSLVALVEPSADEQFRAAFLDWEPDFDPVTLPTEAAAARLKGRPPAVVAEVIAALDEWAGARQRDDPAASWQPLADLAAALDDDPDSRRRELRGILSRGRLASERAWGALAAALRPVPVPFDAGLGEDRGLLRRLTEATDESVEPVLGLLTLARALREAGDEGEAVRLLRRAVAARPGEALLYGALGQLLEQQQPRRWRDAAECYLAARALRPGYGEALARSRVMSGEVEEGLALYARLAAAGPNNPWLHLRHGNALAAQGRFADAQGAYGRALGLMADYPPALANLGLTLWNQGHFAEAETTWRKALELQPNFPEALNNLGYALWCRGDHAGAAKQYQKALDLRPHDPRALCNLGFVRRDQGKFTEALGLLRKGDELGRLSEWRYPSAAWVRECERLVELDRAVYAAGAPGGAPGSAANKIELAFLCQKKQLNAAAARLFAAAFADDQKLTENIPKQHRYNAACVAALAAAGVGEDAKGLPGASVVSLRKQALEWLRADLAVYAAALERDPSRKRVVLVRQILAHWHEDADLASVRKVDSLPQDERGGWRTLWQEAAALLKKLQEQEEK